MHDFANCLDPECEECQELIDEGVIMACDFCDQVGHVDCIGGWNMVEIEKTEFGEIGIIVCSHCFLKYYS